jgi:hypothetical protein
MSMGKILKVTFILFLFVFKSTIGLTEGTEINEFTKRTIIHPPQRVINSCLGLSFDMTKDDAKAIGMIDLSELDLPKNIGVWGSLSMKKNEFWTKKTIKFTPLSNKVYSISAAKIYNGNDANSKCITDYYLIREEIMRKYPSLYKIEIPGTNTPKLINDGYLYICLAEGVSKYSWSQSYSSEGRTVSLMKIPQIDSSKYNIAILTIDYSDSDLFNIYFEEKKSYIESIRGDLLKKKNIAPNDL